MERKTAIPYHQYRWQELTNEQAGTTQEEEEPYAWDWSDSGIMGWVNSENSEEVILEHEGALSDELWENWCREHHCPDANVPLQAEYTIRQKLVTQFMQMQWFKHYRNSTIGWMNTGTDFDFTRGRGSYFTIPSDIMGAVRDRTAYIDDLWQTDEECA